MLLIRVFVVVIGIWRSRRRGRVSVLFKYKVRFGVRLNKDFQLLKEIGGKKLRDVFIFLNFVLNCRLFCMYSEDQKLFNCCLVLMESFILVGKKYKWVGWGVIVCDLVSQIQEKFVCLDYKFTVYTGDSFIWVIDLVFRKRNFLRFYQFDFGI